MNEKSWNAAREYCSVRGGSLATIAEPGERAELLDDMNKQLMTRFAWIGAFSEDGKVWNWTDGTEIKEVTLESEFAAGKAPFCIRMDKKGAWYKYSCSTKSQFICEKELQVVKGKRVVQLSYNRTSKPNPPFQLWYRYQAANPELLTSWESKRTMGFRISWAIKDQNGATAQRNESDANIQPNFVDKNLMDMVKIARQGRLENMTRNRMLEKAISDKNYWLSKKGLDGRKVFAAKCSEGQINLSHDDQIFEKITLGLKDTTGHDDGDFSEEDIANGFAIYSIVVYCSEESEQMQSFLSRLISEETPGTLLKTVINILHSWQISANLKKQVQPDTGQVLK